MPPKIFLTGGTGYIGGSVLHTVASAHPDWLITVLLRRVPPNFTSTYPHIDIVHGDYDAGDVLSKAAENADLVIHCGNSDHEASLNAIIAGLQRKTEPGYLLHLSGTGIVSDWANETHLGRLNPKVWSDTDPASLDEVRSLPDTAFHRNTEKILHSLIASQDSQDNKVNVAIMCPPDIYGRGSGLVRTQSALIPLFVAESKKLGYVFYTADGTNTRSWVHISDLLRLYLQVIEVAARNSQEETRNYFGRNGYHFASTQEHSHLDVARAVGELLDQRGTIRDKEPQRVDLALVDSLTATHRFPPLARYLYASNSRTRAERASELWGYKGEALGLMDVLGEDVGDALGESG